LQRYDEICLPRILDGLFGRAGVPDKKRRYQDAIRVYGNHETFIQELTYIYAFIKSTQEF